MNRIAQPFPMDALSVTIECTCACCGKTKGFKGSSQSAYGLENYASVPFLAIESLKGMVQNAYDQGWSIVPDRKVGDRWYCRTCTTDYMRTAPKVRGVE